MKDIAAGQVLSTTYGPRGNSDLFVHYGFALPNNPYNQATMCLPLAEHFSARAHIVQQSFGVAGVGAGMDRDANWNAPICADRLLKEASSSAAATPSSYRCRLKTDFMSTAPSRECFSFVRVLLASEGEWSAKVLPLYEADEAARLAEAEERGEPVEVPSVAELSAMGLDNEFATVAFLARHAAHALTLIPGGSSEADLALIGASDAAHAANECTGSAATKPSAWFPTGGRCLTPNQRSLLLVRASEKEVLENLLTLDKHVRAFQSLVGSDAALGQSPASVYGFLAQVIPSDSDRARLRAQDRSPTRSILSYFLDTLLPLYCHFQGWQEPVSVAADWRKRMQPTRQEQQDDERMYTFAFGPAGATEEEAEHAAEGEVA